MNDDYTDLDVEPLIARNMIRRMANHSRFRLNLPTVPYETVRSSTPEIEMVEVRVAQGRAVATWAIFRNWLRKGWRA